MPEIADFRVVSHTARCIVGEGPMWLPTQQELLWVDILAPALYRLRPCANAIDRWSIPETIGWIIPRRKQSRFIVGLRSGFAELTIDPYQLAMFAPIPEHLANERLRLNDAKADTEGRIYAGSMDMDGRTKGTLYRLDPDRQIHRVDDGYGIPNGPTFSLDSKLVYHADTRARRVFAYDAEPDGTLRNPRIFVEFPEDWGFPDGMTTDAEGFIWIAHWGGSRVSRFDPKGGLERTIYLPASQITSCVFGGSDFKKMFVTSAALDRPEEPLAGSVFEVDPGCQGLAQHAFAG